ncbi:phage tail assembly chaperone [Pseudomonas caspiana]|uniref:phage tail assembly chaperone n=1 Tax=Pseudomonas caspiana TaxID=1451454 RepID=UPI0032F06B9D
MPFVQRNETGAIVGQFANLQPGIAEQWLDDSAPELLAMMADAERQSLIDTERQWRDRQLVAVTGPRDRHRDELELGRETTLTPDQYAALLKHIQALRDWPESSDFPDSSARPVAPDWLDTI